MGNFRKQILKKLEVNIINKKRVNIVIFTYRWK